MAECVVEEDVLGQPTVRKWSYFYSVSGIGITQAREVRPCIVNLLLIIIFLKQIGKLFLILDFLIDNELIFFLLKLSTNKSKIVFQIYITIIRK